MAERRPSAGSSALNQVDKNYKYGGDTALGVLIPERREILREEIQNQLIGYDDRGREIRQTIPAQYGESEVDFSYSPIVRGAKATGSFLNDIFFGDANEQSEAAGKAVSAIRGAVGGLGDYASSQYEAGMAGGTTYDPETRQITEFDPTIVMGGGSSGGGPALASGFRRSGNEIGDTLLYSGGGRQGSAIAGGSALRNEFERQFGGAIPEVTRDTPLLQRVGDPASVNEMTVEMSSPQISSVPIVKAEDLIDRPYITGMSDTSRSGLERVTSVNDVPVDVLMRGGKYFGAQPENIERGVAFASAPNAVMGQLNRAAAAQSLGGRPVAFIPYGMMPTSPDFATMTTDLMVPYARQVMSKSEKEALDKRIRSGANSMTNEFTPIPDWVGIDKADEEYLANLGGLRKAVEKSLDEFRDAGSLNLSQARAIVTDPTQFNPAFGDIDMIYELNPEAVKNRTFLESNHPSYPAALAGRPLGALRDTEKANIFEFDVLAGTADTEFYNFRDAELAKGRPFEIGGKLKSPTMKAFAPGGHGKITQDMVDNLIRRGLVIP